ncbi:MAG: Gfo/Idh/MocA family oxidoreductase [Clostridia bacterium]|nr:Gfo/Idh/MocA family oxidoreductase [Clostridia bacterium]
MNIGIIGFGGMGKTHAYAVENLKYFYSPLGFDAKILGVCCAHFENALKAKETYGFEKVYADEDELIADPLIDIVDICTPNCFHYETLKKALNAGKHVYCEKPLCTTADEAVEIAELAKEKGLICAVVFNTRFLLPVLRAKELVSEGRIGEVLSFQGRFLHSSATDPEKKAGWKQNRDVCGGGVLFDLGSHTIDLIRWICGEEFTSVSGLSQIAYKTRIGVNGEEWNTNADEAFYLTATLENGACGTITVGKIMQGTNDDHSFEIYGTKGSVAFDLMQPNFLRFYDGTRPEKERGYTLIECCGRYPAPSGVFPGVKAPVGWLRGHVGSMYNFLNAVANGVECYPSFDDGAAVQRIMEAAYESAQSGMRVDI